MKLLISLSKQIPLSPQQKDSHGIRRLNFRAVAFAHTLLSLLIFGGIGALQAQQPDPLTITKDGKVGIGAPTPANKLSVAGDADVSGAVGIGTTSVGTSKLRIANSATDFAHFRFNAAGAGEFEFVGWTNGWNINAKGSAKNLYLNRDTTNSDVLIGPSTKEMIVKSTGSVGIGTTDPGDSKFRITNAADAFAHFRFDSSGNGGELVFLSWTDGWTIGSKTSGKKLYLNRLSKSDVLIGNNSDELVVKGDTGYVGIGTLTPTQAKLVVSGGVAKVAANVGISYFSEQDTPGKINRYGTAQEAFDKKYIGQTVSIYASGNIWSGYSFVSSSDERIKTIAGRSDGATDLSTLLNIEITDYRFKDSIGRGNGAYKKVTGQQVEKVFPQAVSKHTDVVPDIYRQASIEDGWVALATDLKKGERVKLLSPQGDEGVFEVLDVTQNRFRTDFKPAGNRIFVYGREVDDFLSVDYAAISMLNVSATQQIKKEKDEEVKALQKENAALRNQLADQEKRLAAIEALLRSASSRPAPRR
ncbi:MAG TPA: hypothetical protein VJM12_13085 [Pyrinomonadaceae bacterium]|nr:hypothetical protein [Pyrinomonadaceae bacterium]